MRTAKPLDLMSLKMETILPLALMWSWMDRN